jgi:hypothetical protein
MTLWKSILGIVLFIAQLCIALYFNVSVDLKILVSLALPTLAYIVYKYLTRKYDSM